VDDVVMLMVLYGLSITQGALCRSSSGQVPAPIFFGLMGMLLASSMRRWDRCANRAKCMVASYAGTCGLQGASPGVTCSCALA
jgi:hypothetical protein